jgi:dTDP-4-amino-4,6-dideoxygalactose transaminase
MSPIPFVDLAAQHRAVASDLVKKLAELLESSQFILGEELERFEAEFASYCGVPHAAGVSSGTSALELACRALVPPGSEVIVPAHTFVASAFAVTLAGCRPRFVDVLADSRALDPRLLAAACTPRTKAILVVHLYGHPAPMDEIGEFARARGLAVIEDCAQAHGASLGGRRVGSFGAAGCFSFYPSKNLGALGDGGMVVMREEEVRDRVRMLRHLGQRVRNVHETVTSNHRLDSLQAAFLRAKLPHLERWNEDRRAAARAYGEALAPTGCVLPGEAPGARHVYHLYAIRHPRRDAIARALAAAQIGHGVYYPTPVPLQPAYRDLGARPGDFPVADALSRDSIALPMYPELTRSQIAEVAGVVRSALA